MDRLPSPWQLTAAAPAGSSRGPGGLQGDQAPSPQEGPHRPDRGLGPSVVQSLGLKSSPRSQKSPGKRVRGPSPSQGTDLTKKPQRGCFWCFQRPTTFKYKLHITPVQSRGKGKCRPLSFKLGEIQPQVTLTPPSPPRAGTSKGLFPLITMTTSIPSLGGCGGSLCSTGFSGSF